MGHFAKVVNGVVVNVIVAEPEFFDTFVDSTPAQWIQTSYNTNGGINHTGGKPLRKNYAGKGMIYDNVRDAFYWPQPYPSWTLNEDTCYWEAPVPQPSDGLKYYWNEATQQWIKV
jgi:hypothetical protein